MRGPGSSVAAACLGFEDTFQKRLVLPADVQGAAQRGKALEGHGQLAFLRIDQVRLAQQPWLGFVCFVIMQGGGNKALPCAVGDARSVQFLRSRGKLKGFSDHYMGASWVDVSEPFQEQRFFKVGGGEVFDCRDSAKQVLQVIGDVLLRLQRLSIGVQVLGLGVDEPGGKLLGDQIVDRGAGEGFGACHAMGSRS